MRRWFRVSCVLLAATAAVTACTQSSEDAALTHAHAGAVDFPVSCNPAVQDDFNAAVTLLHHMTYVQARSAFRAIAERDPSCAMAQWGIAMTLFQPLWPTRPSKADLQRGFELAAKAETLKPPTAREQAFVAAVAAFFRDPASSDYWQRIQRWESAMASLHAAFPSDREGSAFYALALLASSRPGPTQQEHSRQAVALLLPLLREAPNHPGAMHYIIHADDIPGREEDDIEIVRTYEKLAPDNPHALHMPTHIYTRLGDWDGVIRGNLLAADAALKFPAGENGDLVWDEFPHAIEYLVYAYLQQGADEQAAKQIERLFATQKIEPTAKTAFHFASTRTRYALERQDFAAAAALVPRDPAFIDWDRSPWPEAIVWFGRGYGAARTGDNAEAARAIPRLNELDQHAAASGEDVFARQIRTLRLELEAWNAHAAHDDTLALARMREAVELEGSTPKPPVTPAATLPASELLGDLFIELGRPNDAAAAYRASLQRFPRRFNSTLGLARALAQTGDDAGAADAYGQLLRIAEHGTRASIGEARDFAAAHPAAPAAGEM